MITHDFQRVGNVFKDATMGVIDLRTLPMHDFWSSDDLGTKIFADRLVT